MKSALFIDFGNVYSGLRRLDQVNAGWLTYNLCANLSQINTVRQI